ncbi:MAG: hypothetical protein CSA81_14475 [Acidobacteria bacterium]|nr:MAG: hypothetical protein CSA81_14475 [Acidobacteriota bacterium]
MADGLTIDPTNSVGAANSEVAINLNPTMIDTDGSETVTLTLAGFGVGEDGVTFKSGATNYTPTYNSDTDTYTITGITHAELGTLKFQTQYNVAKEITVKAQTVEDSNHDASATVTDTFTVKVTGGNDYTPPPAPGHRGAAPAASDTYDGILTGSSEADYISGTRGEDSLYGKGGNDILNGSTGADKLYGGLGDDTIIFDPADAVIDGGDGKDSLQVSENVDFTRLATDLIVDMEIIDLEGSGQQSITLDAEHVKAMSGNDNTLLVKGDTADGARDTVNLEHGWTDTGTTEEIGDMVYHVLNNAENDAHLKIQQGVEYHIA